MTEGRERRSWIVRERVGGEARVRFNSSGELDERVTSLGAPTRFVGVSAEGVFSVGAQWR